MATYVVHRSENPAAAAQAAGTFLESRPIEHNMILTLLRERIERPLPGRYWWIAESGEVRGVAFQSPRSFKVTVTPMPLDAVGPLVDAVIADAPDLPGVTGGAATAAAFAGAWSERSSAAPRPIEGQRLYRADQIRPPDGVVGAPRVAVPDDLDLLARWFVAFQDEVGGLPVVDDPRVALAEPLAGGRIWVWEHDDQVVSAAMISRSVAGAARVSFVFTPPEQRARGYAGATVGSLCARSLGPERPFGTVDACLLYTQLHNATSNGVYRRLGFRCVLEVLAYEFGDP